MDENVNTPKVVVEAPEGVNVEIFYGDAPQEKESLTVVEAPAEEPAPVEEPAAEEETPAEEAADAEPERIYASEDEVVARINELEEANANLRAEEKELNEEIARIYKSKPSEFYAEFHESVKTAVAIAETYQGIEQDLFATTKEYNQAYGEVDYLLAYLKSKKEAF